MEEMWEKVASALREASDPGEAERPKNAFTSKEYMERFGISRNVAQKRLAKLKQAGKVRSVRFRVKKDNGVVQLLDGYQLIEETQNAESDRARN